MGTLRENCKTKINPSLNKNSEILTVIKPPLFLRVWDIDPLGTWDNMEVGSYFFGFLGHVDEFYLQVKHNDKIKPETKKKNIYY